MIKSVKNNKTKTLTIKLKAMKADGYEVATATSSKKVYGKWSKVKRIKVRK